jgi:hypothetical protein
MAAISMAPSCTHILRKTSDLTLIVRGRSRASGGFAICPKHADTATPAGQQGASAATRSPGHEPLTRREVAQCNQARNFQSREGMRRTRECPEARKRRAVIAGCLSCGCPDLAKSCREWLRLPSKSCNRRSGGLIQTCTGEATRSHPCYTVQIACTSSIKSDALAVGVRRHSVRYLAPTLQDVGVPVPCCLVRDKNTIESEMTGVVRDMAQLVVQKETISGTLPKVVASVQNLSER